MIKLRIISLMIFIQLSMAAFCQTDLSKPAPTSPNVKTGKLANGMTYYIQHNEEPKERASFYIIQNVGALLENDDQNGHTIRSPHRTVPNSATSRAGE